MKNSETTVMNGSFVFSGYFSKRNPAKGDGLVIIFYSIACLCSTNIDGSGLLINLYALV